MGKADTPLSSGQPDPRILVFLGRTQWVLLASAIFIAGVVLAGWLIPPFGRVLPHGWDIMKANTAILVVASCISLILWQPRRSSRELGIARTLAGFVTLLAGATLIQYFARISLHIDTFVASDASSPLPGRTSLQAALAFFVIGVILTSLRARKRILAIFIDALTLVLTLLVLTFISGYCFGALNLYGVTNQTRMATQTLVCVAILAFVVVTRRSECGIFSILLGSGIGGRTVRLAAPWAICLPFLLTVVRGVLRRYTAMPREDTLAVSASIMSLCGFCLIIALSRRTDRLEASIRELSLRDELTRLYNRRGFYLLAEQMMRLAHRDGAPFLILFIDMDNLKLVNDTHGHEAGSEQIKRLASLIENTFRATDVVGRLGGDEFAVAGKGNEESVQFALDRLRQQQSEVHADSPALDFSFGYVISRRGSACSLDELIEQADAIMYKAKRNKKLAATLDVPTPSLSISS